MTLVGNQCDCKMNFLVMNGKCISFTDMATGGVVPTFSVDNSDCVDKNS